MNETASKPRYARATHIKRIIQTVQACNVTIGSVSIGADGSIVITPSGQFDTVASNDFDRLLAAGSL